MYSGVGGARAEVPGDVTGASQTMRSVVEFDDNGYNFGTRKKTIYDDLSLLADHKFGKMVCESFYSEVDCHQAMA